LAFYLGHTFVFLQDLEFVAFDLRKIDLRKIPDCSTPTALLPCPDMPPFPLPFFFVCPPKYKVTDKG
jgi:hypothetical protein